MSHSSPEKVAFEAMRQEKIRENESKEALATDHGRGDRAPVEGMEHDHIGRKQAGPESARIGEPGGGNSSGEHGGLSSQGGQGDQGGQGKQGTQGVPSKQGVGRGR